MNGAGGGPYQSEDDYEDGPPPAKIPHYGPGNPGSTIGVHGLPNAGTGTGLLNTTAERPSFPPIPPHPPVGAQHRVGNICCLLEDGRRCVRPAGNASYNKRVQKTVVYKRLRLDIDNNAQHIYICDHHKMIIQNARTKPKKESEDEVVETDEIPEVDLYQLQVNTLRRYKKHFKIPTRPGLNKAQLADILMRNFKTIPVSEKEVVTYFIYSVKSERNKLDMDKQDRPGAEYDLTRY